MKIQGDLFRRFDGKLMLFFHALHVLGKKAASLLGRTG
jgi:hypothetical protein